MLSIFTILAMASEGFKHQRVKIFSRAYSSTRQSTDHMDYHYDKRIAGIPSKWRKTDSGNSLPTTRVVMDSSLHRGHRDWFWKTKNISAQQFYHNTTNTKMILMEEIKIELFSHSLFNEVFMIETFLLSNNARGGNKFLDFYL